MTDTMQKSTEHLDFPEIAQQEMDEIFASLHCVEQLPEYQRVPLVPMIGNRPDIQLSNNQTFQKALGVETPMFSGANINGGQFTININFNSK